MLKKVCNSLYEKPRPSVLNLILNIIIVFICLVLVAEIIFNAYFTNIYVKGSSMMPTLNGAPISEDGSEILPGGDYVFVDTHAKPTYSDIVVVQTSDGNEKYDIIKRVIAFGGDTVRLDRGKLFIKYAGENEFKEIEEKYVHPEYNDPRLAQNTTDGDHVVADGCMYLLGDNRNDSLDSRKRGDFPLSSLVGVVTEWSISNKGWITAVFTFFEFTLGLYKLNGKVYGV